ncbi:oligosaccharide flippase family protein [Lacticaseibacillus manihotivorans]|uniref:oligosaccharide flippase family protein n=1 Tax=Lacticaseibacillus manihotivorans TaxID=88233 RepID=UPI000A410AA9|nr:oligosaccharide flippase family protein [Lacticaseibacillus manihotivorans]
MSIINVLAANIPYLVATILVFRRSLKGYFPRVSLVTSTRVKEVLNIGITLLILQLVFMIISSTNELLISHLTNPADVVQYQAYNKIFNTVSSLFTLALTPIWSAVTKAAGEKRYSWIKKLNRILLFASAVVFLAEIVLVPFLQGIIDLWLGKKLYHSCPNGCAFVCSVQCSLFHT